ncbi:MAG: M20/M25/M40 family metallo-hydrolase [Candidatus Aminicenantales bacterium]
MSRILTMKLRLWLLIALLCGLGLSFSSPAREDKARNVPERMKAGFLSICPADSTTYVAFLAADELEGRDTPSKGQAIARRYIQSLYQNWGIVPLGDGAGPKRSFEQRVPMIIKTYGDGTALELMTPTTTQKFVADRDFSFVMGVDFSGTIEAPVVFAGHGVSALDLGYDDFAALDVRNKIVLVAAGKPGGRRPDSPFSNPKHWARFEGRRTPAENCARLLAGKGAAALLVADDSMDRYVSPHGYKRDARIMSSGNRIFSPPLSVADPMVPTFWVSNRIAGAIFQKISKNYTETVQRIDTELRPYSFNLPGLELRIKVDMEQKISACGNVLGMIEGSDPELRKEYVVIGAHLDHIGMNKDGYVFNGADDNASGSAGVLQSARALTFNPEKPRRSVVFAHWTGEEKGLIGSRYFLEFPTIPIKDIAAYINLDMISHDCPLQEVLEEAKMFYLGEKETAKIQDAPERLLRAYVSLPSPDFASLIVKTNKDHIGLEVVPLLSFPMLGNSDHYFFAFKKIPSVFFFTGGNEHAHTPLDTVERMNAGKMAAVVKLAYLLAFQTADEPQRFRWQ